MFASETILVTGANGQLGMELRQLEKQFSQYRFLFVGRQELDITGETAVNDFFDKERPSYCINCAAYTAVDNAEREMGAAYTANAVAAGFLASACKKFGTKLFHISTDYVFAGNASAPYKETDEVDPLNYYGYTKLQGEKRVLQNNDQSIVIRTSWVYSSFGKNFVKTMKRLMAEKEGIGVVSDQFGCPTYAADLALAIMQVIASGKFQPGIYHYCNTGIISWCDFALAIKNLLQSPCTVNPITTSQYPTPAKRPAYSALSTTKFQQTFGLPIPPWREGLQKCIELLK